LPPASRKRRLFASRPSRMAMRLKVAFARAMIAGGIVLAG
jgi:hypothetical protein